jgi:hypothetical protein
MIFLFIDSRYFTLLFFCLNKILLKYVLVKLHTCHVASSYNYKSQPQILHRNCASVNFIRKKYTCFTTVTFFTFPIINIIVFLIIATRKSRTSHPIVSDVLKIVSDVLNLTCEYPNLPSEEMVSNQDYVLLAGIENFLFVNILRIEAYYSVQPATLK